MRIAIHQPNFMPWLGYFDRMSRVDRFLVVPDFQFSKGDYHNRTSIKGQQGAQWLTVPVLHKSGQLIKDVQLSPGSNWRHKHIKTLSQEYRWAPHFTDLWPAIVELYRIDSPRIIDFSVRAIINLAHLLDMESKVALRSIEKCHGDTASRRLVELCQAEGADVYVHGPGAAGYMDLDVFQQAGIQCELHEYVTPEYEQQHQAAGFAPGLSVLDALFNIGKLPEG